MKGLTTTGQHRVLMRGRKEPEEDNGKDIPIPPDEELPPPIEEPPTERRQPPIDEGPKGPKKIV